MGTCLDNAIIFAAAMLVVAFAVCALFDIERMLVMRAQKTSYADQGDLEMGTRY